MGGRQLSHIDNQEPPATALKLAREYTFFQGVAAWFPALRDGSVKMRPQLPRFSGKKNPVTTLKIFFPVGDQFEVGEHFQSQGNCTGQLLGGNSEYK